MLPAGGLGLVPCPRGLPSHRAWVRGSASWGDGPSEWPTDGSSHPGIANGGVSHGVARGRGRENRRGEPTYVAFLPMESRGFLGKRKHNAEVVIRVSENRRKVARATGHRDSKAPSVRQRSGAMSSSAALPASWSTARRASARGPLTAVPDRTSPATRSTRGGQDGASRVRKGVSPLVLLSPPRRHRAVFSRSPHPVFGGGHQGVDRSCASGKKPRGKADGGKGNEEGLEAGPRPLGNERGAWARTAGMAHPGWRGAHAVDRDTAEQLDQPGDLLSDDAHEPATTRRAADRPRDDQAARWMSERAHRSAGRSTRS